MTRSFAERSVEEFEKLYIATKGYSLDLGGDNHFRDFLLAKIAEAEKEGYERGNLEATNGMYERQEELLQQGRDMAVDYIRHHAWHESKAETLYITKEVMEQARNPKPV